jgi:hypothetical protein
MATTKSTGNSKESEAAKKGNSTGTKSTDAKSKASKSGSGSKSHK